MDQAAMAARMIALFRTESLTGLERIRAVLAGHEPDTTPADGVEAVYRAWHTMRGSAAMAGFDALAVLLGSLEERWTSLRQCPDASDGATVELTLETAAWLEGVVSDRDLMAPDLVDDFRVWGERWRALVVPGADAGSTGGLTVAVNGRQTAEPARSLWAVAFEPGADLMRRGVDVLGLIDELSSLGDLAVHAHVESLPRLEQMEPDRVYVRWQMLLCGPIDRSTLDDVFLFVAADSTVALHCLTEALPPVWRWSDDAARTALSTAFGKAPGDVLTALGIAAGGHQESAAAVGELPPPGTGAVLVPRERLDRQMDLVGELVIAQSALAQIALARQDPVLSAAVEHVVRLAAEMRDSAMQLRMVPAQVLFSRLEHFAAASQARHGASLQLRCTGQAFELDQVVVDALCGPLQSVVACLEQGDEPAQYLDLSLAKVGASLVLSLRSEAPGTAHTMFGLLQEVAKRLRAELEVLPGPEACTVRMRLPLSQDIIEGLLVEVGGLPCLVPLALVSEVVSLESVHGASRHGQDILNLRGTLVPFVRLVSVFAMTQPALLASSAQSDGPEAGQVLVTHGDGGRWLGVLVDRVVGQQQVFIKPVPALFASVAGVAGTTILGDGRVALILDLAVFLRQDAVV